MSTGVPLTIICRRLMALLLRVALLSARMIGRYVRIIVSRYSAVARYLLVRSEICLKRDVCGLLELFRGGGLADETSAAGFCEPRHGANRSHADTGSRDHVAVYLQACGHRDDGQAQALRAHDAVERRTLVGAVGLKRSRVRISRCRSMTLRPGPSNVSLAGIQRVPSRSQSRLRRPERAGRWCRRRRAGHAPRCLRACLCCEPAGRRSRRSSRTGRCRNE